MQRTRCAGSNSLIGNMTERPQCSLQPPPPPCLYTVSLLLALLGPRLLITLPCCLLLLSYSLHLHLCSDNFVLFRDLSHLLVLPLLSSLPLQTGAKFLQINGDSVPDGYWHTDEGADTLKSSSNVNSSNEKIPRRAQHHLLAGLL